jgi:steroid delta-isomerase-like uncharacterized protein
MSGDENKALVRRLVDAMNDDDGAAIDRLVAPGFVHRNPADPQMPTGPPGLRQMGERWHRAFPDGRERVEDQIAEGDTVVTRWTFRGTHRGELFGVAPTGRVVTMSGIFVDRIADGRVVEHWDEADIAGLMEQLGAAPA